jgi:hypothetical protein
MERFSVLSASDCTLPTSKAAGAARSLSITVF